MLGLNGEEDYTYSGEKEYSYRAYKELKLVLYTAGPGKTAEWTVIVVITCNNKTCLPDMIIHFDVLSSQQKL